MLRQLLLVSLLFGFSFASPRLILFGLCYDFSFPTNFDVKKFTDGTWYEIQRFDADFEHDSSCVSQTFFLGQTSEWDLVFTFLDGTGTEVNAFGEGNYTYNGSELVMQTRFPDDEAWSSFVVLDTDYTDYSLVYSCRQLSNDPSLPEKQERFWILGRGRELSDPSLEQIDVALNGTSLADYLLLTNQTGCPE